MAEQQEIQLWQTVQPVEFVPRIKDQSESQSLLIQTRQAVGYSVAGGQLAHAIQSRATHMLLDYTKASCAIRYQVDGAWEQLPPMERELGDARSALRAVQGLADVANPLAVNLEHAAAGEAPLGQAPRNDLGDDPCGRE